MADFDDDERSTSRSRPIDLYTITTPSVTYRITSHPVNVTFGGAVYLATTMSRGNLVSAQDLTGRELVVYLPITHPLVQRFASTGVPEHLVQVTLMRLQEASGMAIQAWSGFGQSMSIEGGGERGLTALLRVPALTEDAMRIKLPVIAAQKLCNHVLYDDLCTVSRSAALSGGPFAITAIDGSTVTTTSTGSGSLYAFGDIEHVTTGERRMVIAQLGNVLTLNAPFVAAHVGDSVNIAPGCDHTVQTCRDKFSNVINFGGHPQMNAFNPWVAKGLGVVQQA